MQNDKKITVISKRKKVEIEVSSILYVLMKRKIAEIHVSGGDVYETRTTFSEIAKQLDERFLTVCRGCVVSVMAIHKIAKKIELSNGETLDYTVRKKKQLIAELQNKQQKILNGISGDGVVLTEEEYLRHYASFDNMPFAFTDIEMVFNEERRAVDWIFRYGNAALAKLEKTELRGLIGNTFGGVFSNMDSKWLRCYERVALYGETLETIDYSPEIDRYIKVICFPTFKWHCGCILFDIRDIQFTKNSADAEKATEYYLGKTLE
ncbi:MAG: LytTR family transcriptional regulator DNA-binding domain-containing protein [Candidatus Coproplasma sp.]